MGRSPIALFVYNRPEHTAKAISALRACAEAAESDLTIFSDAPKAEKDQPGVLAVREIVRSVHGFRNVTLIEREENMGLARSIISGVTDLVNRHGRLIVMEDDLVASPHFLAYMNNALDYYESNERVISIHGYVYPVNETLPETFLLRGADCWGWGTWKRGWALFEQDGETLLRELRKRRLTREFDFGGAYAYTNMLERQVRGEIDSWAIRWYASAFLRDKLTLYPGQSLISNIGHDASGSHCGSSGSFDTKLTRKPVTVQAIPVRHDERAEAVFASYFRTLKPGRLENLTASISKLARSVSGLLAGLRRRKPGYYGNYASWADAARDSGGYDSGEILKKVTAAMMQVRDGKAAFERDSVIFDKIEYSWPLLAALLWIASQHGNSLKLIDFGGSLGSSYYQNREFLLHLDELSWNVVEQTSFVSCGREYFTNEHLHFHGSIEECLKAGKCETILFASVLPYMEKPFDIIDEAISAGFRYILIDRTPVIAGSRDRLTVQIVPPSIYEASYPAWFIGEEHLISHITRKYELVASFDSLVSKIDLGGITAREKGYIFKRKD